MCDFNTSGAIAWRGQITHIENENERPKIALTGGGFKGKRKETETHKNNGFFLTDDLERRARSLLPILLKPKMECIRRSCE